MYNLFKRSLLFSSFLFCGLLLLPGCGQYICHIQNLFIPAGKVCTPFDEIQCAWVRTVPVRPDGFMTLETIRFLYKSNEVIEFYEHLQGDCAGEREEIIEERMREQEETNEEQTIFFVSLYTTAAEWAFTLVKDGHVYKAAEMKVVELDRNYKAIFGVGALRYRQHIYQLSFDAAVTPPFEIIMCNGEYLACASWE